MMRKIRQNEFSDYLQSEISLLDEELSQGEKQFETGFRGVHILIADDDQQLVFFIRETLNEHFTKAKINHSTNCQEILSLLDIQVISVLITGSTFYCKHKNAILHEYLERVSKLQKAPVLVLTDSSIDPSVKSQSKSISKTKSYLKVPCSKLQLIDSVEFLL